MRDARGDILDQGRVIARSRGAIDIVAGGADDSVPGELDLLVGCRGGGTPPTVDGLRPVLVSSERVEGGGDGRCPAWWLVVALRGEGSSDGPAVVLPFCKTPLVRLMGPTPRGPLTNVPLELTTSLVFTCSWPVATLVPPE